MKPELVVVKGPHRGLTMELDSAKEIYIGRSRSADISLPTDKKVSQLHAKLMPVGPDRFILEDLGSTNGTYVNGKRMEQTPVQSGDRVKIGHSMLVYRTDAHQIRAEDFYHFDDSDMSNDGGDHIFLFSRLIQHIAKAENLNAVLPEVLETVARSVGAHRAIVFFRDPLSSNTQQLARFWALETEEPPLDAEVLKRAAADEAYVCVDEGIPGGAAAVPLRLMGTISGAIYFDMPGQPRVPSACERELLNSLSDALALALARDRQRQAAEMAAELLELVPLSVGQHSANLSAVLEQCIELYREVAQARGVNLTKELEANLAVSCDQLLLNRALERLIEYVVAVSNGAVHVATRRSPDNSTVQVSLSHSGRGFENQALSQVFSDSGISDDFRFALNHGLDGLLPFCRGAVELAGGSIMVHSQGPDQGAAYLVSLPTAQSADQSPQVAPARRQTERYT